MLSLFNREKCHSGAARHDQETLQLPAELALGAGAGQTRGRRRAGAQECRGAISRRRLLPGRGITLPRAAALRPRPRLYRPQAGDRTSPAHWWGRHAKATGAAGATHPVQVEALGASRGLLGAGAQAHGHCRLGRRCPGPRRHQRTHPLGARLPAPCHVGAWPRPPLTLTPLESGRLLRFQGRARLQQQAATGATGTLTRESRSARHHQTRTRSRRCPEMSINDSSLMVRGPGTAQPLPPGLSAPGLVTPAPCSSPVTSLTARAASATRLSLSPASSGCLRPFSPHSPWQANPL